MSLSENKCNKKIINESDKLFSMQGTQKSNNNTIYLKIGGKTEDTKLSLVVRQKHDKRTLKQQNIMLRSMAIEA